MTGDGTGLPPESPIPQAVLAPQSAALASAGSTPAKTGATMARSMARTMRDIDSPSPRSGGRSPRAIRYPTRQALADAVVGLRDARVAIDGASDHGVSEAIYLRDPDGNGLELYWDRPKDAWPRDDEGRIAMFTAPLDVPDLLAELA
jgi:catechol-2,3-dioxygenase